MAVVASRIDLGAIPSLYGTPTAHARYLGLELRTLYAGVLLIVMPAGFGIYGGGRSTAAQQGALTGFASAAVNPSVLHSVRWRVPATAPAKVRYCVTARDASRNTSKPVCASISIAPPSA